MNKLIGKRIINAIIPLKFPTKVNEIVETKKTIADSLIVIVK